MSAKSLMAAVAVDLSQADGIGVLLENFAESRIRLERILLSGKAQIEGVQSSIQQTKATWDNKDDFCELLLQSRRMSVQMGQLKNLTPRESKCFGW